MSLTKQQLEQKLQELEAQLARQQRAMESKLTVKLNQSGGVYIRHDSFREWSTAKNKEYVAGVNMGYNTALTLFNNPELIEQVRDMVNSIKR